jgi:hypothetical protein
MAWLLLPRNPRQSKEDLPSSWRQSHRQDRWVDRLQANFRNPFAADPRTGCRRRYQRERSSSGGGGHIISWGCQGSNNCATDTAFQPMEITADDILDGFRIILFSEESREILFVGLHSFRIRIYIYTEWASLCLFYVVEQTTWCNFSHSWGSSYPRLSFVLKDFAIVTNCRALCTNLIRSCGYFR